MNQHQTHSPQPPHRFITLSVTIDVVRALRPVVALLKRVDKDLANQIHRAASSVALNLGEGSKRTGGDRLHSFRIAAGSAAEVRAALEVADAWGYLGERDMKPLLELLDRQAALLYRLLQPSR